jgi:ribosome-binding factor A
VRAVARGGRVDVSRRTLRLNRAIQQEISRLVEKELNDPRLVGVVSITEVSMSEDMRHVRVYVSAIGDAATQAQTLEGFKAASGFIRREVSTNLRMRHAPEFSFEYDNSIERGAEVLQLIERVTKDD